MFDLIPVTLINLSSKYALCIIVLHEAIEKGMPHSFAITFARLTDVRDAIKVERKLRDISFLRVHKSSKTLGIP